MLGKSPKKIQKSENAGKVRSLHHIDDEDYDDKGNYLGQPMPKTSDRYDVDEPAVEEKANDTLPENNMTAGATLKDDSDRGEKKARAKKNQKSEEIDASEKDGEDKE